MCVVIKVKVNRIYYFFFFNDTATTEIYTLSLHDALPICDSSEYWFRPGGVHERLTWSFAPPIGLEPITLRFKDRKSTRLNSSHANISYAVFCLKKKNSYRPQCHDYAHAPTDSGCHALLPL